MLSGNFPDEGVVSFTLGQVPPPRSDGSTSISWARFPFGVDYILHKAGYQLDTRLRRRAAGATSPAAACRRSASLSINLILTFFDVNRILAKTTA